MKTRNLWYITLMILSTQTIFGQRAIVMLRDIQFYQNLANRELKEDIDYEEVEGSPYYNKEFAEGIIFLTDTTAVKVPVRYNIFTNEMEYQWKEFTYVIGEPQSLKKIVIGGSTFVYVPFIEKGSYVELLAFGKCNLVQKRSVRYKPAEGPKPIEGTGKSAEFVAEPDLFYIAVGHSEALEISGIKMVTDAFPDQKDKIAGFIKSEKIRRANRENLIKIVTYYNSL